MGRHEARCIDTTTVLVANDQWVTCTLHQSQQVLAWSSGAEGCAGVLASTLTHDLPDTLHTCTQLAPGAPVKLG
jgi:hypothetical protein